MKFYGEMRVQGSGPLDGARFDALAYALAEIEQTDPAVQEVDLTASLAQGWVTASMIIDQPDLELAVTMLIATVRTAIYPNGDIAGSWKFLAETAEVSIRPAADRRAGGDPRPVSAAPAGAGLPVRGGSPAVGRLPVRGNGTAGSDLPARGGPGGDSLPVRGGAPAAAGPSGRDQASGRDPRQAAPVRLPAPYRLPAPSPAPAAS